MITEQYLSIYLTIKKCDTVGVGNNQKIYGITFLKMCFPCSFWLPPPLREVLSDSVTRFARGVRPEENKIHFTDLTRLVNISFPGLITPAITWVRSEIRLCSIFPHEGFLNAYKLFFFLYILECKLQKRPRVLR